MRKSRNIGLTFTRILISIVIIKDLLLYIISYKSLFGSSSIVPIEIYDSILKFYKLPLFNQLFTTDISTLSVLLIALTLAIILMLGLFNKVSGLLLFLILLLLKFRNVYIMDGGDNLILVLLPFIALGKSKPLVTLTQQKLFTPPVIGTIINTELSFLMPIAIIIQVCLVYFFAGLYKIVGPLWQNGTAIFYVMRVEDFKWTNLNYWLTNQFLFVKSLTYLTLIWELSFPFLIIKRKIKNITIAISVFMHLGIFIFMHIDNYSFVMIFSYFVFFTDREYVKFRAFYRLKLLPKTKKIKTDAHLQTVLFFDGNCNLCNGFINFLIDIDKNEILKFSSLQSPYSQEILPGTYNSLKTIVLIDNGHLYIKSDAILNVFNKLGGLWRVLYIFKLIPAPVRNYLYDFISKRRYFFNTNNTCRVPTPELKAKFINNK